MIAIGLLFLRMLGDRFRSPWQLEVEILVLRHQLNVLQRRAHGRRSHLGWLDRALFIWLYRRRPRILDAMRGPTVSFDRLFAFLVLGHGRHQLLWFAVTRHPTVEWLARQITEALPWTSAPTYLVPRQ